MGVFFSEALALIAAVELSGATHLLESGTAEGQSTEILARYFSARAAAGGGGLNITTIDRDTLYRLYAQTKQRLAAWPSVACIKGDSFVEIPRLLSGLPPAAKAVVFVDGPKGKMGMQLALQALEHPKVALVALHDAARVWDAALHEKLRAHPETILMTSDDIYRRAFGSLDIQHDEERVLRETYAKHKWPRSRIPPLLAEGNGLWLAGKSKLLGRHSAALFDSSVHVAMSSSTDSLAGLLACISSVLSHSLAPAAITIHLLVPSPTTAKLVANAAECLRGSSLALGARLMVHNVDPRRYRLLRGRSEGAVANLLRFYLPDLLPVSVDKLLWVDVDGLVIGDVRTLMSGLFTGEHAESALAAVERPGKHLSKATGLGAADLAALGLSRVKETDTVFNAGLLGINLRVWREQRISGRIEALVERLTIRGFRGFPGISTKEPGKAGAVHDSQTPLVLLFKNTSGSIQPLPPSWNTEGLGWKEVARDNVCAGEYLHWSGKHKPWQNRKEVGYHEVWLQYAHAPLLSKCA